MVTPATPSPQFNVDQRSHCMPLSASNVLVPFRTVGDERPFLTCRIRDHRTASLGSIPCLGSVPPAPQISTGARYEALECSALYAPVAHVRIRGIDGAQPEIERSESCLAGYTMTLPRWTKAGHVINHEQPMRALPVRLTRAVLSIAVRVATCRKSARAKRPPNDKLRIKHTSCTPPCWNLRPFV